MLSTVKAIYDKPTASKHTDGENRKHFHSDLQPGQHAYFHHQYSMIQEILTRAIRQEKEIQGKHFGKEGVKLSLFTGDMILHTVDSKDSTRDYWNS